VAKFSQKVKFENEVILEAFIQWGKKLKLSDTYIFFSLCSQKYKKDD
jgi:hypothetical protein